MFAGCGCVFAIIKPAGKVLLSPPDGKYQTETRRSGSFPGFILFGWFGASECAVSVQDTAWLKGNGASSIMGWSLKTEPAKVSRACTVLLPFAV